MVGGDEMGGEEMEVLLESEGREEGGGMRGGERGGGVKGDGGRESLRD